MLRIVQRKPLATAVDIVGLIHSVNCFPTAEVRHSMSSSGKDFFRDHVQPAIQEYTSQRRHPALFGPCVPGSKGWREEWFTDQFNQLLVKIGAGAVFEELLTDGLITEEKEGIYSIPMFKK